jgi:hypothetical protein
MKEIDRTLDSLRILASLRLSGEVFNRKGAKTQSNAQSQKIVWFVSSKNTFDPVVEAKNTLNWEIFEIFEVRNGFSFPRQIKSAIFAAL